MATTEYMQFTIEDHREGRTAGWNFAAGWFQFTSGLTWAWFWRPADEK